MSEWISVKKEWPVTPGEFWLCFSDGTIKAETLHKVDIIEIDRYIAIRGITHFQYLCDKPEPPEEYRPIKLEVKAYDDFLFIGFPLVETTSARCNKSLIQYRGKDYLTIRLHNDSNINAGSSLSRREVAALIPVLQRFVDTGSIKEEE